MGANKNKERRGRRKNFIWYWTSRVMTDKSNNRNTTHFGFERDPNDPWAHVPLEDIIKTIEIWHDAYQTSINLFMFVEQTLGKPYLKSKDE